MKTAALIVAGGSGKRMNRSISKQYLELKGKPILAYTIEKFQIPEIDEIVVVIKKDDEDIFRREITERYGFENIKTVYGGKERADSVVNGLKALSEDTDTVLIHDGVRPFVSRETILENIEKAEEFGAVLTAVPSKDTVKIAENGFVKDTPQRSNVYLAQTPQSFRKEIIAEAYKNVGTSERITDDSMAAEAYGKDVYIVEGTYDNIKITTEEDLPIGEKIIESQMNLR